jgi:hypothetical protein
MPSADQVEKVVNDSESKEMKAVEAEIAAAAAAEGGEEIQAFPIVVKTLDGAQIQIQVGK